MQYVLRTSYVSYRGEIGGSICHVKAYEQPKDLTRRDETNLELIIR